MASDDKEYEQSALGKRVNELMDDGYDFGEAVKQAMSEGLKDGGSVGIEILFGPKREDFNIGGRAKRNTPIDSRASAVEYAEALQKVSGGTQAQKRQDLSNYLGNVISTQGQKLGNAAVIPLQAAKGVLGIQGTPITDSMQSSLQNIIQKQIKDSGKLSGNLNYLDYGVLTDRKGQEFLGFGDRSFTDPEAALATTLGKASYAVDPKTGKITFTGGTAYDFGDDQFGGLGKFISKGGVFSDQATQYNPDITLGSDFMKQFNQPKYPDYKTAALQSQYYKNNPSSLDSDLFRAAYARATDGPKTQITNEGQVYTDYGNYDPSRTYAAYMSNTGTSSSNPFFDQFKGSQYADMPTIMEAMYGTPGNMNPYYADGGRVGLFMGGDPLTGQALSIYDSMKAYNFSDQEIANALSAQGLYTAGGTTDTPDTTIQPIGFQSGNGGGGGGITELDPLNRPKGTPFDLNSLTKTKFGYNNALGRTIEGVKDFTGSMIDKFSGSKIGEGITEGATKFKNFAITPMMALAQKRNPLNPNAMNYNPNLQKQMDFLEGTTGTRVFGTSDNLQFEDAAMIGRDPNSGLAKYGPGSVLSGQNVVSGFGTNDYEQQLANYISKMRNYKTLTNFQKEKLEQAKAEVAKEIARREQETADRARAANPGVYASADRQGFTDGKGGGFGSKSTGTNDAFSNESGRGRTGYSEGGLATMFKEKR